MNVISRSGYHRARLPNGIARSSEARAIGNLILTSGNGTVIALR